LPDDVTGAFDDVLGLRGHAVGESIRAGDVLSVLPVALLVRSGGD
jgi:hypothetical protein